jgi:hypothetical protein
MSDLSSVLVITAADEGMLTFPPLGAPLVYATSDTVTGAEWSNAALVLVDDRQISQLVNRQLPRHNTPRVISVYTDYDDAGVFARAAAIGAFETAHARDDLLKVHAWALVQTCQMQWVDVFGAPV